MNEEQKYLRSKTCREKLEMSRKRSLVAKMRAALPTLNKSEIQSYRLPYHEAILFNLREAGYSETADLLRQLFEKVSSDQQQVSTDQQRPLRESREQVEVLVEHLVKAEQFRKKGNRGEELGELLELAVIFYKGSFEWWWLSKFFLKETIDRGQNFTADLGKTLASARYILGLFYMTKKKNKSLAKEQFIIARKLSRGEVWSLKDMLGFKQRTIFIESCMHIYRLLIEEADKIMLKDPSRAYKLCAIAQKRAGEACYLTGQADALLMEGLCDMKVGEYLKCHSNLYRAFIIYKSENKIEDCCKARYNMAQAYMKMEKDDIAMYELKAMQALAEENHLPPYIALSHKLLGEFYLRYMTSSLALPHLLKAQIIFRDLKDNKNGDQAMNLVAIAAGLVLIEHFFQLIIDSPGPDLDGNSSFQHILEWKNIRTIFWQHDEDDESEHMDVVLGRLTKERSSVFMKTVFGNSNESILSVIKE